MSSDRNTRLPGRPHDYKVGYGKPPKKNRFKKGESGNPRGRPKGAKSRRPALPEERLRAIVLKEAYRTIDMRERDRTVSLPMAQAIIRALNVGAAKGQFRAQRLATEMLTSIERERRRLTTRTSEWLWTTSSPGKRNSSAANGTASPMPRSPCRIPIISSSTCGRHRANRWSFDERGEVVYDSLDCAKARIAGGI